MNEDDTENLFREGFHESEGQTAAPFQYPSSPEYGEIDYLQLPGGGEDHYSLEDAALIAAIDLWSSDRMPGFPLGELSLYEADTPEVRKGIEKSRQQFVVLLSRSVENGSLNAKILGRNFNDSKPLPTRTYVQLDDLISCLEQHGQDAGDYILGMQESISERLQENAAGLAESRAAFRYGDLPTTDNAPAPNDLDGFRRELRAQRLHIAHLQAQLGGSQAVPALPLASKERNTLLCLIAVLCQEAKIDYSRPSKAAESLVHTASLSGIPLSKRAIEEHLKRVARALESRAK